MRRKTLGNAIEPTVYAPLACRVSKNFSQGPAVYWQLTVPPPVPNRTTSAAFTPGATITAEAPGASGVSGRTASRARFAVLADDAWRTGAAHATGPAIADQCHGADVTTDAASPGDGAGDRGGTTGSTGAAVAEELSAAATGAARAGDAAGDRGGTAGPARPTRPDETASIASATGCARGAAARAAVTAPAAGTPQRCRVGTVCAGTPDALGRRGRPAGPAVAAGAEQDPAGTRRAAAAAIRA
jgi:hypothetical protein